jgi:hypothetical protein
MENAGLFFCWNRFEISGADRIDSRRIAGHDGSSSLTVHRCMSFHTLTEVDGVARLQALGRIVAFGPADLDPFVAALGRDAYRLPVTLCLARTAVLDSAAIGCLLSSHRKFKLHGGKLVLHSLRPHLLNELKILRVDRVLHLVEDEEAALALAASS